MKCFAALPGATPAPPSQPACGRSGCGRRRCRTAGLAICIEVVGPELPRSLFVQDGDEFHSDQPFDSGCAGDGRRHRIGASADTGDLAHHYRAAPAGNQRTWQLDRQGAGPGAGCQLYICLVPQAGGQDEPRYTHRAMPGAGKRSDGLAGAVPEAQPVRRLRGLGHLMIGPQRCGTAL